MSLVHSSFLSYYTYRQAFFTDLRYRIQRGMLAVPHDVKPAVGALTAQVEIGSYKEAQPRSPALVYPAYFPDWSEGIAYSISKEHKKLIGTEILYLHKEPACTCTCTCTEYVQCTYMYSYNARAISRGEILYRYIYMYMYMYLA